MVAIKGSKRIPSAKKRKIALEYAATGDIAYIKDKYHVKSSTIYDIVNKHCSISKEVEEKLSKSMEIGAGIVGNLAIAELNKKNLSKEKPRSLSAIAVDMHKIATGQPIQALQVNVTIPNNREEILSFLQGKSANNGVIDTSATTVLSDNEIMPDK